MPQGLKPSCLLASVAQLNRLLKKFFATHSLTSAAKAAGEDKPVFAGLKRCATQNQVQHRLFSQPAKPCPS